MREGCDAGVRTSADGSRNSMLRMECVAFETNGIQYCEDREQPDSASRSRCLSKCIWLHPYYCVLMGTRSSRQLPNPSTTLVAQRQILPPSRH